MSFLLSMLLWSLVVPWFFLLFGIVNSYFPESITSASYSECIIELYRENILGNINFKRRLKLQKFSVICRFSFLAKYIKQTKFHHLLLTFYVLLTHFVCVNINWFTAELSTHSFFYFFIYFLHKREQKPFIFTLNWTKVITF